MYLSFKHKTTNNIENTNNTLKHRHYTHNKYICILEHKTLYTNKQYTQHQHKLKHEQQKYMFVGLYLFTNINYTYYLFKWEINKLQIKLNITTWTVQCVLYFSLTHKQHKHKQHTHKWNTQTLYTKQMRMHTRTQNIIHITHIIHETHITT